MYDRSARVGNSTIVGVINVSLPRYIVLPLAREDWRIEMMNPDRRRTSPFVLGGDLIQASYPTDEMTEDEKLMCMREIIRTSRTPPWFTSSIPVIICKAS